MKGFDRLYFRKFLQPFNEFLLIVFAVWILQPEIYMVYKHIIDRRIDEWMGSKNGCACCSGGSKEIAS
jgi:hypothetical protein